MEREKLFYDLHQTIKEVGTNSKDTSLKISSSSTWIKQLTGEISQMKDETLNLVLDIYERLTSYTRANLNFIILHTDLLEYMLYEYGEIVEEHLALLYTPYAECLVYSPIITKYCFKNNISGKSVWNATTKCTCHGDEKSTIEKLILDDEVESYRIIEAWELLLELYKTIPEFVEPLIERAGPLYKTLIEIHNKTDRKDVENQLDEYTNFLERYKYDNKIISKVIDYITSHEFVPYKTVEAINLLDIKDSDKVIAKYGNNILNFPVFRTLLMKSQKIADKLYELYSSDKLTFK